MRSSQSFDGLLLYVVCLSFFHGFVHKKTCTIDNVGVFPDAFGTGTNNHYVVSAVGKVENGGIVGNALGCERTTLAGDLAVSFSINRSFS